MTIPEITAYVMALTPTEARQLAFENIKGWESWDWFLWPDLDPDQESRAALIAHMIHAEESKNATD